MSEEATGRALPWPLRTVAWLCLLLSSLVTMGSTNEAVMLLHLSEVRAEGRPPFSLTVDPAVADRAWRAQLQALEGMSASRTVLLSTLALCGVLSLMGAARLLWPAGFPREPVRQMLSGTTLVAGILRTLDGAQSTVVARRTGAAMAGAMSEGAQHVDPVVAELARKLGPTLAMGGSIVWTALVAGAFVLISQYLRSERVRQLLSS